MSSALRRRDILRLLPAAAAAPLTAQKTDPHLQNLYPMIQGLADRSPLELSFLKPEFRDLARWQRTARAKVLELAHYSPGRVDPAPELIHKKEREGYTEEYLTFRTSAEMRVPAYVLIPKTGLPAPGIVVLHSHDGIYLWGKEKVVELDNEHPYLTKFKKERYGGKSIASELARQGYVTMAIDLFYWGSRRMVSPDNPEPAAMTDAQVSAFNRRASENESLVARSLVTAGVNWGGVMLWDDLRTLDYLASRREVNPNRMGCIGLSVGGWRSLFLAGLDTRIKAAVAVGWMASLAANIRRHVIHTTGFSFFLPGLYHYLDVPDVAAMVAQRPLMVINGSRDQLFELEGVKRAFTKIEAIYKKAGAADRQRCLMYDAPHQLNLEMQAEAWKWLKRWV